MEFMVLSFILVVLQGYLGGVVTGKYIAICISYLFVVPLQPN